MMLGGGGIIYRGPFLFGETLGLLPGKSRVQSLGKWFIRAPDKQFRYMLVMCFCISLSDGLVPIDAFATFFTINTIRNDDQFIISGPLDEPLTVKSTCFFVCGRL